MVDRRQVQDPLRGGRRLRTAAQTLDTFVTPADPGPGQDNTLSELATALSDFRPTLKRYGAVVEKADAENAIKQAQADRLANRKNFADATAAGMVPAGANPHYVREYKRMDGELAASGRYLGYLTERWQTSGLAERNFPTEIEAAQAYEEFVSNTRADFLRETFGDGEVDSEWVVGFEQRRASIEGSVASRQVTERIANNEAKFESNTSARIGEIMEAYGDDPETLSTNLNALARHQRDNFGIGYTKFNELLVKHGVSDAMAWANEGNYFEASEALERLANVQVGTGPLGNTAEAKAAINAATAKLTQMERADASYNWSRTQETWARADRGAVLEAQVFARERRAYMREQMQESRDTRDRKDTRELVYADVMTMIVEDPTQDFEETWNNLAKDPNTADLIPTLEAARTARINANTRIVEDPEFLTGLRMEVMMGQAGPEEIATAVAGGQMSYTHAVGMLSDWDSFRRAERAYADQRPEVSSRLGKFRSDVYSSVVGSDEFASPARRRRAAQAAAEFDLYMLEFLEESPDPSPLTAVRKATEVMEIILNSRQYRLDTGDVPDDADFRRPDEARAERDVTETNNPFDVDGMVEGSEPQE